MRNRGTKESFRAIEIDEGILKRMMNFKKKLWNTVKSKTKRSFNRTAIRTQLANFNGRR